jgi:hypothetical protein
MPLINTTTTGAPSSIFSSDGTGPLNLQQDGVTIGVYGNQPAFRAYLGTSQNITNATWTKVQLNTETFDTNNNFDNSTNYRFTPTVAGYYQLNAGIYCNYTSTPGVRLAIGFYKNGSSYIENALTNPSATLYGSMVLSSLMYFNGTSDYVELYGLIYATGPQFYLGTQNTYMDGILVKAV